MENVCQSVCSVSHVPFLLESVPCLDSHDLTAPAKQEGNTRFKESYAVSRKTPSLHLSIALRAAGLVANSTMPFPTERPRSSTITTALSTTPNWENASSRSSLETYGDRLRTDNAAEWVAKRTLSGLPFMGLSSSSAFATSAKARDS